MWCATLWQTESFSQPGSVFRTPTAEEYEKYGHGKPLPAPKKANKHESNRVVYEDISEVSDVPTAPNVGVDDVTVPYDDPLLSRVRLRSYSAAAGSAKQAIINEVVVRGVEAGPLSHSLPLDDVHPQHMTTQTDRSYGLSDVVLNRIEHYVRRAPLPWQVRTLLPGLFNLLPSHDPAMLAIALTSVIRGIRIASKAILSESAAHSTLKFEGRDVMVFEDRLVHLLRASGVGPVM